MCGVLNSWIVHSKKKFLFPNKYEFENIFQSNIANTCSESSFRSPFFSGSSHIQSALIDAEYPNFCQTLDVYLLFAIWMGQIQSK